tara:strand:- start:2767 stop:3273 length:507 start_codon:yes stop_codon:yes gene_type:complete
MTRALLVLGITLAAALPAKADITHKIQSSVSLAVDGAATSATRVGSSYSVSGMGVSVSSGGTANQIGSLDDLTSGSAVDYTGTVPTLSGTGSWSFSETYMEGDDTPSTVTITSGVAGSLPLLGINVVQSGGVAGSLAGTIDSGHSLAITAGGAGTQAVGQVVTSITAN